jgi:hypothetical protein
VSLVLDASVTLSWYFEGEQPRDALLDRVAAERRSRAPSVWRLEARRSIGPRPRKGAASEPWMTNGERI